MADNDVHVDIYDRGDHYEIKGKSADGSYDLKGTHEKNREGAIAHAKEAIANHNRESPDSPDYTFETYTYH